MGNGLVHNRCVLITMMEGFIVLALRLKFICDVTRPSFQGEGGGATQVLPGDNLAKLFTDEEAK